MINATEDQTPDQNILAEQVKSLYQSMQFSLIMNLVVSISLVYGFWDVIAHSNLTIWMSLMLVMLLTRTLFIFSYKRNLTSKNSKRYRYFLIIGSALNGIIWGMGGVLLFSPTDLTYQLFMLLYLYGVVMGSTFSLSVFLPAYFAFAPLALLPIIALLFSIGDSIHTTMGLTTVMFLIIVSLFNIKINRSFNDSLLIRYENNELIEQLRVQKIEADNANLAKSKFLAAASHDLRQPLYALSLFTTVLDEIVNDPKVKKIVDQIDASVNALKNLFDALLDISQLDAGVMKADKSNFNLQDIFTNLENDFTPLAAEKGLTLNWPACSYVVHSEPNLLEQILRNYLSNAIRYTQQGSIEVTCEINDAQITIKVADTGLGIAADEHQHIFSEFYQLDNPERDRHKGLGLGLSIVQRTASLLEHKIAIQSQLGQGSVFSVTVTQADDSTPVILSKSPSANENMSDISSLIVVIDDEKSIREGLQQLLEIWQYDVVIAEDAESALQQLQLIKRIPNAIISDFRLRKNQTGIDVIDAIHKAYHTKIPALIITGDIEKDRLVKMNTSHFEVLYKPVPLLKLRAFLRNVTQQKKTDID